MFTKNLLKKTLLTPCIYDISNNFKNISRSLSTQVFAPINTFKEDETLMREMVGNFARDIIAPKVGEMDKKGKMDDEIINSIFQQGLMGIEIPEKYGGVGASFTTACLCIEELAMIDPAVSTCVDVHNTVVNNTLKFWGSDALKEEWMPKLATNTMGSFCLSEPGSGSDAFSLATKAELSSDGSEYKINGNKLWITNAEHAGLFLCFANVDHSLGYKGITCFVVPGDADGVEVGPAEDKLGIRASSTCPVTFNDVIVPKSAVLGKVGHGYKYAIGILNEGRIGIGAQMVGLAQGVFDQTMPYLFERKQFGESIGNFQGMEMQYADIAVEIEAARLMVYNAARLKESGMPFIKEAAMAKLKASLVAEMTSSKCVEWLGGVGFTKDYGAEKFFRDCKIGQIYEGTNNIQRSTIAKYLKPIYE